VLMGVSRQTFGRIVESARRKVATALLEGRALVFEEGHVAMRSSQARRFECGRCMRSFMEPHGTGRPAACPHCGSSSFERAASERGHAGPCTGRGRARGVE
jgi:DNA-directed RNA polymerase subunit RPC12/RpoP